MAEPRSVAVERMVRLMERAHRRGVELVVFPELALTTFFPRHYHADVSEADHWFETAMPSNATAPLFAAARKYGIGSISAMPNLSRSRTIAERCAGGASIHRSW